MKKILIRAGVVSLIGLSVSSCSTKGHGKKIEQNSTELAGNWDLGCSEKDFMGFTGVKENLGFSFIGDYERSIRLHDDTRCKTEVGRFDVKGTYAVLGATANTTDGTRDINLTLSEFDFTILTDSLAAVVNGGNFCGRSDWAVNQTVSLLGLDCAIGKINRGDVIYDIFLIEKNSLFFNDQLGVVGFRPSAIRPEKLDTSHPYVKKSALSVG